jgi:thiaminase/transcriptional activator TenA
VFGYAISVAPSLRQQEALGAALHSVLAEEVAYFRGALASLGMPCESPPSPTGTCHTFCTLLQSVVERQGSYAEAVTVLCATEWVYLDWATNLRVAEASGEAQDSQAGWVDLHAKPGFMAFVSWLRGEVDCKAEQASQPLRQHLAVTFQQVVELEVAFFEAALEGFC